MLWGVELYRVFHLLTWVYVSSVCVFSVFFLLGADNAICFGNAFLLSQMAI